uniref:Uncharacterized protein n=1 Tax=Sphaerodactylus townsendi TaxID=933632 RepID=A0ACB8FWS3_9SAUR
MDILNPSLFSSGMEDNTSFEEDATQIDESHWRGSTPAPGNLPPVCGPSEDSDSVSPVRVSNTTGRLPTPSLADPHDPPRHQMASHRAKG